MNDLQLTLQNINISYNKFKINSASLTLRSGDILGLIGKSGSGKSTIINTILGLKKQDSGKIYFTIDQEKSRLTEHTGYSPQSNALYPTLTVEENIMLFSKLHGVKRKEAKERMEYLLKKLKLTHARDKKVRELSGGMEKRADFAAALISDPKLLILDEPFNGLDVLLIESLWEVIKDIAQEGRIVIVSSHLLVDIQRHCNQFGLVDKGYFYGTDVLVDMVKRSRTKNLADVLIQLYKNE